MLLQSLHLNDNQINFLEAGSFYKLLSLKYHNLSNNPLHNLPANILKNSFKLKLLHIISVNLTNMHTKTLQELDVKVVITSEYSLCCITQNGTLRPTYKPWYISCSDILPKGNMKAYCINICSSHYC